ncbi:MULTISPECIES: acyl-ACP--UDP-N-acetylglucosamine O-acyltransferase [unclassified Okeania]|uniref:acyl-ACP--UDP-N-acetylglucosamine O-acyltransferase n=1 Tax=unclassified Okeania TaxID=2634635 RepID=UPI0013BD226F|nr:MULTISPECIES: acyl-ACP--UDP-N-acetylglucosamine O-acyltransferase [unclassified Okeania]NES74999.1 acyl-ACP--UDP-N-acetylglucosamine O-acyltransferase [Okeania sp. SIO1H4]NET16597.1 acyl-ACP--UDP-N-acetylglucosamine O-acyltransferase [Okeania sp. SIO1H6]NET20121.1 acyl-ACP--UDP-N-acetylglucosamine O-acyltransferase [Okeania sp. SIO1H5]NET92130.1 acyl-ACP--UDP-N-acetylglucosamine O-acyltransferase [Okeania sp. SIO1H2]
MPTLIHPTAVIAESAELHPTVQVGPYAVIEEQVKVGAGTTIGAHVVIEGPTEIGSGNRIFPGAAIGIEPQDLKYAGAPSWVKIGNNNKIREYVTVNRATYAGESTVIGNDNLLMAYVHVAHNCIIEDSVVIANAVSLAGHVKIESKAVIGGVLGIHQFVHIGKMAMVGGMSRIVKDVPPFMLVEGHPCLVRSLNLLGLKRAGLTSADLAILKKAFRTLYRSGRSLTEALAELELDSHNKYIQKLYSFLSMSLESKRRGPMPGKMSKGARLEEIDR